MSIDEVREALLAQREEGRPGDIAEIRARVEALASPLPEGWRAAPIDLGRGGERLVGPQTKAGRTIFFLHGGAYCAGSIVSHRALAASLAMAAEAEAVTLDYRLAPEDPFPAALDDAIEGYRRLLAEGRAAESIAFMGDSAGGGLALALAARARAEGLPQPLAIAVIAPWADLTQSGGSYGYKAESDPVLTKEALDACAALYLAGADARDGRASPVFADLAGLAPVLIQVGGDEVLLSDSESFIAAARAAGVDATVEIWPGLFHVWHIHLALEEAQEAIGEFGGWLKRRWKA
ncbi:MAG: alpha/beta hydrolase fold domain-containing protein [Hyphomonadaceae bacterium]